MSKRSEKLRVYWCSRDEYWFATYVYQGETFYIISHSNKGLVETAYREVQASAQSRQHVRKTIKKIRDRFRKFHRNDKFSSKYPGVCLHKPWGNWIAYHDGKYLGKFETEGLANFAVQYFKKYGRSLPAINQKESKMTTEEEKVDIPVIEYARRYLRDVFSKYVAVTLDELAITAPEGVNRDKLSTAKANLRLYGFNVDFGNDERKWVYSRIPQEQFESKWRSGEIQLGMKEPSVNDDIITEAARLMRTIKENPILRRVFNTLQWAHVGGTAYTAEARLASKEGEYNTCGAYKWTICKISELQVVLEVKTAEGPFSKTLPLSEIYQTAEDAHREAVDRLRALIYDLPLPR